MWFHENSTTLDQEYINQKCTSQKKQNATHGAVDMTTVTPLVLFQLRLKFPDFILNTP